MTARSPFGTDVSTFRTGSPGLDPTWELVDGPVTVVEIVARRFLTPHGTLEGDSDFGHDVRQYMQARQSAVMRARARMKLRAEALKEQRVKDCTIEITTVGKTMTISAILHLSSGQSFSLTIGISELAKPSVQIALLQAA
jgi:hypothetical protein